MSSSQWGLGGAGPCQPLLLLNTANSAQEPLGPTAARVLGPQRERQFSLGDPPLPRGPIRVPSKNQTEMTLKSGFFLLPKQNVIENQLVVGWY